jgi:hypothetical protein
MCIAAKKDRLLSFKKATYYWSGNGLYSAKAVALGKLLSACFRPLKDLH